MGLKVQFVLKICDSIKKKIISISDYFKHQDYSKEKKLYLFSWDDIPGVDDRIFLEYLENKYGINWVRKEDIEKIGTNEIKVANEKNFLSLRLNNKKANVTLTINELKIDEFIVKYENRRRNIYKKFKNSEQSIHFINLWYQSFQNINKFFAGLTLGILFFTATFLLNVIVTGHINDLNLFDFNKIKYGIISLGLSFLFYSLTIIFDYNWFIEGLHEVMQSEVDLSDIGELFNYRHIHIPMSIYGKLDQLCSHIATIFLLIGIIFYGWGSWKIFSLYLGW
ncbi:MAG: hypothetical protein PHH85_11475 [Candidatus Methanoperedens sp.]|nr:hypothetical protein [Candidatus Methanoperedens sp.]